MFVSMCVCVIVHLYICLSAVVINVFALSKYLFGSESFSHVLRVQLDVTHFHVRNVLITSRQLK